MGELKGIRENINFELDAINGEIVIWDSGPGFHRDITGTLFEPYESMKPDGRGLGLYIVRELVKSLNGSIYLSNETNHLGNNYKLIIKFNAIR